MMTYDVEHVFICLLAIYLFSSVRCLFRSLAHCKLSWPFSLCSVLRVLYIFWYQSFIRYIFCKYFLPICGLSFHFHNSFFLRKEVSKCNEVQLFLPCIILVLDLKSHYQKEGHPDFLVNKCILFIVVKYT